MKWLPVLIALFAFSALAADISGNWKATAEGPNGALERTFTFKQDGTKLTGETTSSFTGKSTITDGKVEGDSVTFTIVAKIGDQDVKLNYKGKIAGGGDQVHERDGRRRRRHPADRVDCQEDVGRLASGVCLLDPFGDDAAAWELTARLHRELYLVALDGSLVDERDVGARSQFHHEGDLVTCYLALRDIDGWALGGLPGAGERSAILFKSVGDLNCALGSLQIGLPVSRDVGGGSNHGENCNQESRFYQLSDYT